MTLRTLGRLELAGKGFRRAKPLLLAAYLALEGSKPRRYLAEIFWPGASDALNSLSVALSQLRRGAPGLVEADESHAWSSARSDAAELREAFRAGRLDRVVELYEGPFLEGLDLELGEELEEWLYANRESLAAVARESLLRLAELTAGQGRFEAAGELAERAFRLAGGAPPEPEELVRFEVLLAAADSPALADLRREAASYGIELEHTVEAARSRIQKVLLGRAGELAALGALEPGQWAWLRGESGMGKTSLLRHLEGVYLPARSGLPLATLEPVLGQVPDAVESGVLDRMVAAEGTWLIDDWEAVDEESRQLIARLRSLHPKVSVVIAASSAPAVPVDVELTLGPLAVEDLDPFPEAWDQTGGLPELVGAYLREEPVEAALGRHLGRLDETARLVYLALGLVEVPDLAVVRRSLGLSGAEMGQVLGRLLAAGLIEASGTARARQSVLAYLEARPNEEGPLALRLARGLSGIEAFPLYRRARAFWEPVDLPQVVASYRAWAEELMRRGFARRAVEVLAESPASDEIRLLRARALEQSGQYREALDELSALEDGALVWALRSSLYWRTGEPDKAREAANRGIEGNTEARAEALNTLGMLASSGGNFSEAASYAKRAAALWKTLGNQVRWVGALNNLGIARTLAGEPGELAFREALEAAGDSAVMKARTLLNVGWTRERENQDDAAEGAYREAAALAGDAGATEVAAWAWNNLGVLHHKRGLVEKATDAYENALALAQRAGEQRILGMVMANLAELEENYEAWEEALRILEKSGHDMVARDFRNGLDDDHPFRARAAGAAIVE